MRSVLENLGNSSEESLNPTEVFVHRAFCSVSGRGGADPLSALDSHREGGETELDLARSNLIWPFQCLFTKSC